MKWRPRLTPNLVDTNRSKCAVCSPTGSAACVAPSKPSWGTDCVHAWSQRHVAQPDLRRLVEDPYLTRITGRRVDAGAARRVCQHECAIAYTKAGTHAERGVSRSRRPIPCDVQQTTGQMDRGRRRRSLRNVGIGAGIWLCSKITATPSKDHGQRLTMSRRSCRQAMRQSPSHSLSSPAAHAIARPNSRVPIRLSVLGRCARCFGANRPPGLATVCQPPLADAMEVTFVSGRSESQPGVWRAQVNVPAVL